MSKTVSRAKLDWFEDFNMIETLKKTVEKFDSCVIELPKEFALANGFPEKCFVSLTMRDGKLNSEIIEYTDQDERDVEDFINEFPDLSEELKRIGG